MYHSGNYAACDHITFTPEHESCESQVFSFYGIKYAASDLTPSAWWSFDDSNLVDKVSGFTFEQTKKTPETVYEGSEFTDGIGNGKALRAVESIDGDCNFYTFPYTPAWYNDKSGISLALSGKFKRHGTVGFSDPTTDNFTDGHHFAISWDYAQPKCALPLGAASTKPETTAKDRVDYNWHHLALTMTEVLNPKTDSRFIVDYSQNEYGTITYVSSDVNYSETLTNTKYVDYFNGFKILEVNKTKRQNSPTLKNSQKFVKWGQWFNTRSNSEKVINADFLQKTLDDDKKCVKLL